MLQCLWSTILYQTCLTNISNSVCGRIDLLLGQDIIHRILRQGFLNSPTSDLYSVNTMFGWVIGGYCTSPQVVTAIDADTNDLLRAFWETEEPPSDVDQLSHDDQVATTQVKGKQLHHWDILVLKLSGDMSRTNAYLSRVPSGQTFRLLWMSALYLAMLNWYLLLILPNQTLRPFTCQWMVL